MAARAMRPVPALYCAIAMRNAPFIDLDQIIRLQGA
jgi:hypothetical protein